MILTINSGTFLFALDNTIVADIQPAIVDSFGSGSVSKLPWLANAFALAAASLLLPWSKFYSTFDSKWLYILSVVLFEVGSALCGGAPNMNALIVGRAIAGIGAIGIYIGRLSWGGGIDGRGSGYYRVEYLRPGTADVYWPCGGDVGTGKCSWTRPWRSIHCFCRRLEMGIYPLLTTLTIVLLHQFIDWRSHRSGDAFLSPIA